MASSLKRICWDACAWIALIQKEKIQKKGEPPEDRYAMCRGVLGLAEREKAEIVVSGLCLVEVCKNENVKTSDPDKIAAFFEHSYILIAPVDKAIATRARGLMMSGIDGLKPPDATHVATALMTNADEMHTFDKKLLDLNGKLAKADGKALLITKPGHGGAPLSLFGE